MNDVGCQTLLNIHIFLSFDMAKWLPKGAVRSRMAFFCPTKFIPAIIMWFRDTQSEHAAPSRSSKLAKLNKWHDTTLQNN